MRIFRYERTSTSHAKRSKRPVDEATSETIERIYDMVQLFRIMYDHLDVRRLSASWVPRLLTVRQKPNNVTNSKEYLSLFNCDPIEF